MKIGINASFVRKPATGIGQVSVNFINELAKHSSDNSYILYLEEDIDWQLPKNFEKRVVQPLYRRDDLIRKIWFERFLLPREAKKDQCDLFFSLYQCPTILPKSIVHLMLVHDLIPKIFPNYLSNWRKKIYQSMTEKAIKQADRLMAVSLQTEKDIINLLGISTKKISVNYIDVDPLFKQPIADERVGVTLEKYGLKRGHLYYGGGLEQRKNIENLILAYKRITKREGQKKFPPLVISGKKLPKLAPLITDVDALIEKHNLSSRVKAIGFVEQEDLPSIYKGSLAFIFPSRYEGFGLPVLEAMNMSVPVIASKNSSLQEVGGDAIMYCKPDNIKDIARSMERMVNSKEDREVYIGRGKEQAKKFSWGKFVKKFLEQIDRTRRQ